MRKFVLAASAIILLLVINACKKTDSSNSSAKTVQNLSGSYSLTALTASLAGISINLYDSLSTCEKDNVIQLNTDGSAHFIDDGVVCVPSEDSTGTWSLSASGDSLTVGSTVAGIKSWDGKTLVLTNTESISGFPVLATTTLVKK
jgi:Lipocalin-like domain